MNEGYLEKLRTLHACREAVAWVEMQKNPQQAWDACERGDWMLWLCGKQAGRPWSAARKKLVFAACECVRLALPYVTAGEIRPLKAIETAEQWAHGKATGEEMKAVVAAASSASAAAASAAAAYATAAYAAAYATAASSTAAASSATAAASAAASAAAYAAAYAVDYAADADAYAAADVRKQTLKRCADIVRKWYPKPPIGEGE